MLNAFSLKLARRVGLGRRGDESWCLLAFVDGTWTTFLSFAGRGGTCEICELCGLATGTDAFGGDVSRQFGDADGCC